jgi:hypothetical protein
VIYFKSDSEIAAIGECLLDLSLPKPRWTHAAHFAAALWLISCRRDLDASRDLPGWLLDYWTRARLFSVEARRTWVEPDLKPLPF